MWQKLKTIVKSRLTKPKEDKETLRRRSICKGCEYNSLNMEKIPFKKLVWKKASDFYSWIAGKEDEDNLGNCTICNSCSVYYKSAEELEDCKIGRWNKK